MTLDEEHAQLHQANAALQAEVTRWQGVVTTLEAPLAELRPPTPPSFVNPNKPAASTRPRQKRDPVHHHGRPRATPTEVRTHAYDTCPTCADPLTGASLARRREVLDLPPRRPSPCLNFRCSNTSAPVAKNGSNPNSTWRAWWWATGA